MSKRKSSSRASVTEQKVTEDSWPLPLLSNLQEKHLREEIFVKKLLLCKSYLSSAKRSKSKEGFRRPNPELMEARRRILFELIDYISVTDDSFDEQSLELVVNLVEEIVCVERPALSSVRTPLQNFYPKENSDIPSSFEVLEDETNIENSEWSLIQLVYELFIQMITSDAFDTRTFVKYITKSFISKLFHLFCVGDIRERDYLKTILHRIYQRFIRHRSFLRKKINEHLFSYNFEGEPCDGIRELLEVQSSIVHGFAYPLKEEHKFMLFRYLMPLHRKTELETFFPQLLSCVHAFAQKDPTLIPSVLSRLFSSWPNCNSMKQILFINEVEIILQSVTESVFAKISKTVWLELLNCTRSFHFQVAERALCLWNDTNLVKMMATYRKELFINLIESVDNVMEQHWCYSVRSMAHKVRDNWMQATPDFFQWFQLSKYDRGGTLNTVYSEQKRESVSPCWVRHYASMASVGNKSKNFLFACTEYKVEPT